MWDSPIAITIACTCFACQAGQASRRCLCFVDLRKQHERNAGTEICDVSYLWDKVAERLPRARLSSAWTLRTVRPVRRENCWPKRSTPFVVIKERVMTTMRAKTTLQQHARTNMKNLYLTPTFRSAVVELHRSSKDSGLQINVHSFWEYFLFVFLALRE